MNFTGTVATVFATIGAILFAPSPAAQTIKGKWHTKAKTALVAAKKAKQPVLAVAMDHG